MLMMSSWWTALRSSISRRSSWTRSFISSVVSASSVVAPRNARTAGAIASNLVVGFSDFPVGRRQREVHDHAAVVARLGPDVSAVALDDLLADRQADAAARTSLGAGAPVEHGEHRAGLVQPQPGPVVGHRELPPARAGLGGDVDLERPIRGPVLHRVANEVLEKTSELRAVGPHYRQTVGVDRRPGLFDFRVEGREGAVDRLTGVRRLECADRLAGEGVAQQVVDERAHALGRVKGPLHEVQRLGGEYAGRPFLEHLEIA